MPGQIAIQNFLPSCSPEFVAIKCTKTQLPPHLVALAKAYIDLDLCGQKLMAPSSNPGESLTETYQVSLRKFVVGSRPSTMLTRQFLESNSKARGIFIELLISI
eukprot:c15100_g1_i1.p3 GENE.c15100_g1_i1~~c15100_g1_i1.p3  ORF type:complete len:104 (-),score=13.38 c15100_g1_i1:1185-1496(-)